MKNKLILKYPAAWWGAKWRDALPSGNGVIGAAVYGAVHNETVLLTHDDLWHEVVTPDLPDVSAHLSETRNLLLANKAAEADKILSNAFKAADYQPDIGAPLPLGDLKVKMPVALGFTDYRRVLDMASGEVLVSWKDAGTDYERRLFVSRADDCVVMELRASTDATLDAEIALDLHDRADARMADGNHPALPANLEIEPDETGLIRYAAQNDDGTDFGAVARVSTVGGKMRVIEGGLAISDCDSVLIVLKLFVRGDRTRDWSKLETELDALPHDYASLLAPHAKLHADLFGRVALDLDVAPSSHALSNEELLLDAYQGEASNVLTEKMWAFGRYLLISSSREGGQPCPLQGKWCGSYRGYWTFNMMNENLQMNHWQALSGNLTETLLPVFDYCDRLMPDFRENARKLYGCRGIHIPAVTTPPSGLIKDIQPHILHWTGAAAWVGQHYYDYYLYTGDETFLRERALPFLRETALFYEDFFTIDDDGFYLSAPSNSPENTPANHLGATGNMETTMNATLDFALAKEVLTRLIEGTKIAGDGLADVEKWHAMLERIPPYQINSDGAVAEWMHPFYTDNYKHRHQSHIYPVFPGTEVTRTSDPDLFRAFERAIHLRLETGISSQTGWSLAHMANVYARMHDGDGALNCLNLLARSCLINNFYTTHNDWRNSGVGLDMELAPYQIDANLGWTAAVQEMLLFSEHGHVTLLPALPSRWANGSVRGLLARNGVEISIQWSDGGRNVTASVISHGKARSLKVSIADKVIGTFDLDADVATPITWQQ